jgi:cbb3-type cytochrome oxidase maturation protein
MEVIIYLILPTLFILPLVIWGFFWAVKDNQYEDLNIAGERILHIDEINRRDQSLR